MPNLEKFRQDNSTSQRSLLAMGTNHPNLKVMRSEKTKPGERKIVVIKRIKYFFISPPTAKINNPYNPNISFY